MVKSWRSRGSRRGVPGVAHFSNLIGNRCSRQNPTTGLLSAMVARNLNAAQQAAAREAGKAGLVASGYTSEERDGQAHPLQGRSREAAYLSPLCGSRGPRFGPFRSLGIRYRPPLPFTWHSQSCYRPFTHPSRGLVTMDSGQGFNSYTMPIAIPTPTVHFYRCALLRGTRS